MFRNTQQQHWRGHYRWRASQRAAFSRSPMPEEPQLPELPLGLLISEFKTDDFAKDADQYKSTARITECSVVAAWNWTTAQAPEMLVPGLPPRWSPPAQVERLCEDSGEYLRDRNAARYPAHPIEPVIFAAMNESPEVFGSDVVDIVACCSSLANLLRFIRGEEKSFRVLVEKIGNTIFLIRREKSPTEKIIGVRGFGHTFPEAYTTWDSEVKSSASHQRVLLYSLGGLQCLVRFEADGYIPDQSDSTEKGAAKSKVVKSSHSDITTEALVTAFDGIGVAEPLNINASSPHLSIKRAGNNIPQHQVFDLKTRSERKKYQDTMSEELPRLWLSQIHKFVLGYHQDGLFNDVKIFDVRDKVLQWEQSNSEAITRLLSLINRIRVTAGEVDEGKFEVCHMKDRLGILQFRHQLPDAGSALSSEMEDKWLNVVNGEDEIDASDSDESSIGDLIWDNTVTDYTACSTVCGYCGQCSTVKLD